TIILMLSIAVTTIAQTTVKGQVVDVDTDEPLIGATVTVEGVSQGSVTDVDGNFTLKVAKNVTLIIKYLGYKDLRKKITREGVVDLGILKLTPDAIALNDVTITSSVAIARKTPVAVST